MRISIGQLGIFVGLLCLILSPGVVGNPAMRVVAVSGSPAAPPGGFPVAGLQVWYKLDEASGNAIDSHTNGYDMEQVGTVGSSPNDGPQGLHTVRTFDTTASFRVTDAASGGVFNPGTSSFTACGWTYGDPGLNSNASFTIFGKKQGATTVGWMVKISTNIGSTQLRLLSTSEMVRDASANFVAFPGTTVFSAPGQWFHWVLVVDRSGDTMYWYVDGAESVTADASGLTDTVTNTRQTYIGSQETFLPWNGKMARVGWWNRALSAQEVETLYNNGSFLDP